MSEQTPEPPKKKGFFDQLKDATQVVVDKTRDSVEDLQQRRELDSTYEDLGRKTAELVASGAVSHPDLTPLVEKARELEAELAEPPAAG